MKNDTNNNYAVGNWYEVKEANGEEWIAMVTRAGVKTIDIDEPVCGRVDRSQTLSLDQADRYLKLIEDPEKLIAEKLTEAMASAESAKHKLNNSLSQMLTDIDNPLISKIALFGGAEAYRDSLERYSKFNLEHEIKAYELNLYEVLRWSNAPSMIIRAKITETQDTRRQVRVEINEILKQIV